MERIHEEYIPFHSLLPFNRKKLYTQRKVPSASSQRCSSLIQGIGPENSFVFFPSYTTLLYLDNDRQRARLYGVAVFLRDGSTLVERYIGSDNRVRVAS